MIQSSKKPKAKQFITRFLKDIANEKTETVCIEGEDVMVSKAESLARLMWKMALGYEETKVSNEGVKTTVHKPDKGMMGLLFDRIEGRAIPVSNTGKERKDIADKISDQGKNRIAQAGGINND